MSANFEKIELQRYARQLVLPEFNLSGQIKLKNASVLVVGAGGLGSSVLLYLVAAGVGNVGIVDYDSVDLSNLQRQILYDTEDIDLKKAEVAAKKLKKLNPYVNCVAYDMFLTNENALNIISQYDLVIDGTDNFPVRYLINDACVLLKKPFIYGSIYQFEGQVSVFNYQFGEHDHSPCYRCLFPNPPPANLVANCSEGGVLGVLPGIIGCLQTNEAIKLLTLMGDPLIARLFIFDSLNFETRVIEFSKDPDCFICSESSKVTTLQDYDFFCRRDEDKNRVTKEITARDLNHKRHAGIPHQLIDVREAFEVDLVTIGGDLISLGNIEKNISSIINQISVDKDVIFYCRDGSRSKLAIQLLEKEYGLSNLYNLRGGIQDWVLQVDPRLPYY